MMTKMRIGRPQVWGPAAVVVATLAVAGVTVTSGQHYSQQTMPSGQNVAPSFEGWEEAPDGSFNMVFGYFNRNWVEQVDVPIGPANTIEPGGPDRGQPTHFFPRRNKFIFRVPVPKDFGNKEVIWTLTAHGKTEKAYGTLKDDYKLDKRVLQTNMHMNLGVRDYPKFDEDMAANEPPVIELEGGARRTVNAREPLALNAVITDDGKLARIRQGGGLDSDTTALGLRVTWFIYRGPADKVTFSPEQLTVYQDKKVGGHSPWTPGWMAPPVPPDGKFPVRVTFGAPGEYTVRVLAADGGLDSTKDIVVTVK